MPNWPKDNGSSSTQLTWMVPNWPNGNGKRSLGPHPSESTWRIGTCCVLANSRNTCVILESFSRGDENLPDDQTKYDWGGAFFIPPFSYRPQNGSHLLYRIISTDWWSFTRLKTLYGLPQLQHEYKIVKNGLVEILMQSVFGENIFACCGRCFGVSWIPRNLYEISSIRFWDFVTFCIGFWTHQQNKNHTFDGKKSKKQMFK